MTKTSWDFANKHGFLFNSQEFGFHLKENGISAGTWRFSEKEWDSHWPWRSLKRPQSVLSLQCSLQSFLSNVFPSWTKNWSPTILRLTGLKDRSHFVWFTILNRWYPKQTIIKQPWHVPLWLLTWTFYMNNFQLYGLDRFAAFIL